MPAADSRFTPKPRTAQQRRRRLHLQGRSQRRRFCCGPTNRSIASAKRCSVDHLHTEAGGTVYLDLVRDGQTVSTRAVPITAGRAASRRRSHARSGRHAGTARVSSYSPTGTIVRDTRLVARRCGDRSRRRAEDRSGRVSPRRSGAVSISPSPITNGAGAQSAIGLAIVDESVFALAEQDPGFAKLYFLLEQELLQPKYDLHGFSLCTRSMAEPARATPCGTRRMWPRAPRWPKPLPRSRLQPVGKHARRDVTQRVREMQQSAYFGGLNNGLYALCR